MVIVQPVEVNHDWMPDEDYRLNSISFDIVNDVIDFGATPELCGYRVQQRPLSDGQGGTRYDRWSDEHMKLEWNEETQSYRMTLVYGDSGFNFERIWLKWRLPVGCRVLDTTDRL